MERKILIYALPFFALSIVIDFLVDHFYKTRRYRMTDSITSLSSGFLGTTTGVLTAGFVGFFYEATYRLCHQLVISDTIANFALAAFVYDFLYYWYHRAHHRINVFWAAHATHHNSEYFNFSTALRQSSLVFATSWPFFLPMAVLGFTFEQYLFSAGLSVIYGFYTHTEHLNYIPGLEYVLVGPSSHRVHHGINPRYVDKNYGSILNIWDRMFGTYEKEDLAEAVVYGTITPLKSFNPFYANLAVYWSLLKDAINAHSHTDRVKLWFRETGWRPLELEPVRLPSAEEAKIRGMTKFDTSPNLGEMLYVLFNFSISILATAYIMAMNSRHSLMFNISFISLIWICLLGVCYMLETRKFRFKFEMVRLLLTAILGFFLFKS